MSKNERQVPDRGDVIEIDDPDSTYSSAHSLLTLSSAEYNERTGMVIGLVVSSDDAHATNPFAIALPTRTGKNTRARYVLANAVRTEKWVGKSIAINSIEPAPEGILPQACETLNQIIEIGE